MKSFECIKHSSTMFQQDMRSEIKLSQIRETQETNISTLPDNSYQLLVTQLSS